MSKLMHYLKGFSILEALIALVVVGVSLLGVAKLQTASLINSTDSRMKTHALNLAQEKIEELRGFSRQEEYGNFSPSDGTEPLVLGSSANFTRSWSITNNCVKTTGIGKCDADGDGTIEDDEAQSKRIIVTVSWSDAKGDPQQVILASDIAQIDPVKAGVALAGLTTTIGTTTTAAATTTTAEATTTTAAATTTTAEATTTTTADGGTTTTATPTTTTTTAAPTTTTTTTTTTLKRCYCKTNNPPDTAKLNPASQSDPCSDCCCTKSIPSGTVKNVDFEAFCPVASCQ